MLIFLFSRFCNCGAPGYATGLMLDPTGKFLLVAERLNSRILKVDLETAKKHQKKNASKKAKKRKVTEVGESVFAENLPIYPERVTLDADGEHVWVAGHPRHSGQSLLHTLSDYPTLIAEAEQREY